MFFDLFNIKPPEWHQAFIDGRRLTSTIYPLSICSCRSFSIFCKCIAGHEGM